MYLPPFCHCFASVFLMGVIKMNELVISTYIRIMQDGLVEHNRQEAAGRFILDSIAMQEAACVMTNIEAKKISNLVNRKDPVPDDIRQASLKQDVAEGVKVYFEKKVVPDLNQYTREDTLEKIMNVIIQDVQIAKRMKERFRSTYDSGDIVKFLTDTFLYSLQRNNKKTSDTVEYQDAPLLAEVNYECPITHVKLIEEIKGVPKKKYEITQIFPDGLSEDMEAEFSAAFAKPDNLDSPSNLIALSLEASESYTMKPTFEEYVQLCEIKAITSRKYRVFNAINRIELEEEIRVALDALVSLTASKELPKLEYEALRIDEKISNVLLQNEVQNHVLSYYRYIESTFSESTDNFDEIAAEVKLSSQKLEKAGLSQEEVINCLAEWIHNKAFEGEDGGILACRIIVSFFIQNCEVFYK